MGQSCARISCRNHERSSGQDRKCGYLNKAKMDVSFSAESFESIVPGDEFKEKFKKNHDITFYRRQRDKAVSQYFGSFETLVLTDRGASLEICQRDSQDRLSLQIRATQNGTVRVSIDELQPVKPRYHVSDVLVGEMRYEPLRVHWKREDSVCLTWGLGQYQLLVSFSPFNLEISCDGEEIVTLNPENKLYFETLQDPTRTFVCDKSCSSISKGDENRCCLWKETFRQFEDIKANGPSSVGMDLSLHGFNHTYGLPEHADTLVLKDTSVSEAYRLYNLDVFGYDINSRLGLYGSVPVLIAHKPERTAGVFWLNASETLVDVKYNSEPNEDEDEPPGKKSKILPQTNVRWISESGTIDCFIFLGPTPAQVFSQYAQLTGYQALPPLFSLGYHQCRWNYEDEADVKAVDAGFDSHSIPYDVIWLDIEHTDGKRYFTWDSKLFPNPAELQHHLQKKNRKLVVISDPHVKIDPDWPFYCEAKEGGHFVKNREGTVYEGTCWPGALQPFFRGHSAKMTKRREPWLFGDEVTSAIRSAVQDRYCLLPYWYTLFHQAHTSALPPIRPLWVEFPSDTSTFAVENQYMIGSALLVCPVTDPGVTEVSVLLPGSDELWYDTNTAEVHKGARSLNLPVTLNTVPVFQRGGTVVPRRAGCGSSTADLQQHPITLTVALDTKGNADGFLYLDDGHSFSYRDQMQFCLRHFSMQAGRLVGSCAEDKGSFVSDDKVESVVILGLNSLKRKPKLKSGPLSFVSPYNGGMRAQLSPNTHCSSANGSSPNRRL
ncbi:Neutral alpha-glucosidase C [Anabarilius grahami]|uniref:Neutral alpha-glucosidase C n=1 Tax=Anabarilius grahami TaxID=495550 RepID=A0A3N0Z1X2_ANAGA|nr:Neutral alpha-glucosidase C [Anabarilius grahami]